MSNAQILHEPYVKHPRTPLDLGTVDRRKRKPAPSTDAVFVERLFAKRGREELLGMLFDPIQSGGVERQSRAKRVES